MPCGCSRTSGAGCLNNDSQLGVNRYGWIALDASRQVWRLVASLYILLQIQYIQRGLMKRKRPSPRKTASQVSEPKVAMSYRLSPDRIARAQRILGTPTATATIEEALDMVVFRRELIDGVEAAFGTEIVEAFPDPSPRRNRNRRG